MAKGRTKDTGKSPSEEHRYGSGQGGEGDGKSGPMPSNDGEEKLFPIGQ